MNYEQRYKESLARAKEQLDGAKAFDYDNEQVAHDIRTTVYNIFPELKESKSERIRKELIKFVKSHLAGFPQCEKYIAWLENQGEHKSIWHNEDEEPQKGSLILLIMQSGTPVVAKIIESNHTFNHGERWAYIDDLLEKQSEQKPQGKSALEVHQEDVDNANKVEPKFNLYDWVVTDKGGTVQIGAVNNGYYTIFNGMDFNMSYVDKCWHKWTIKDAKDGDVLVSVSNQPFIYNGKFTEYTVGAYCGLNVYGVFVVEKYLKESNWTNNDNIRPATKEQRDILMKEIHRANFKWDADKKELIKL
jgi:hypothetical protein